MRALQERIKILESENSDMKHRLKDIEGRGFTDRERWQTKFVEEMQLAGNKEKTLHVRMMELEEKNRLMH